MVVELFANETRRLLIQKEAIGWNVRNFERDSGSEIDQVAIDFIAPLFARDNTGVFTILRNYFLDSQHLDDSGLQATFQKLIFSNTQQELIRLFSERDPIGKILHRSLRYILSKHDIWTKTKTSDNVLVIANSIPPPVLTIESEITSSLEFSTKTVSLTRLMESILVELIENQKQSVPVSLLFQYLRRLVENDIGALENKFEPEDPILSTTIEQRISDTLKHLDSTILNKYESSHKITKSVRQLFQSSLSDVLKDHADGGTDRSYYSYLKKHATVSISEQDYKRSYKKQFEYIAKIAKKEFSAYIRNDFNL